MAAFSRSRAFVISVKGSPLRWWRQAGEAGVLHKLETTQGRESERRRICHKGMTAVGRQLSGSVETEENDHRFVLALQLQVQGFTAGAGDSRRDSSGDRRNAEAARL
ncbi:MAG: hypothetical protein AAFQ59_09240 [Pseudomonadota bacterium]